MTCTGCSGAVTRVLEKAKVDGTWHAYTLLAMSNVQTGVSEYNVNLESQLVTVKGTIPYDDVLAKIQKTGKEVSPLHP